MEKFNFKLQKVLEFKLNIEQKKKEEFASVQRQYYNQEKLVKDLVSQREEELRTQRQLKNSFEFQNYFRYIDYLDKKITNENENLFKLGTFLNEKKNELIKSVTDRKTLEKLKEKERYEFDIEVSRQEQKLIDDFALIAYTSIERR